MFGWAFQSCAPIAVPATTVEAFHLDTQPGEWFEMLSVGVVCPSNLTAERLPIAPGGSISRFVGVATPGTYRFRVLVDGTSGSLPQCAVDANRFCNASMVAALP